MNPEKQLIKDCIYRTVKDPLKQHQIMMKLGILEVLPKTSHVFLTIQFRENETLKYLELVNSLISFSWMKNNNYLFNLEFYSKTTEGRPDNPHAHILITLGTGKLNRTKILRDIRRRLGIAVRTVNYQASNNQLHYLNRKNYILGIKRDKKQSDVSLDDNYRAEHNILKYYTNIQCPEENHTNVEPPPENDVPDEQEAESDLVPRNLSLENLCESPAL